MVSFATLFFGLVFGVVDVEVRAPVATERVELLLGGEKVAELRRPFAGAVDLGGEPVPGELVAIAYDAGGRELGRALQQVNSPRESFRARRASEPEVHVERNRAAGFPERTAVPVVLDEGAALPGPDGLAGWFAKEGRPLEVAAVSEGGFDVVFVCEPSAFGELRRVFAKRAGPNTSRSDEDLRFRFLLPSGFPADETGEPGMQGGASRPRSGSRDGGPQSGRRSLRGSRSTRCSRPGSVSRTPSPSRGSPPRRGSAVGRWSSCWGRAPGMRASSRRARAALRLVGRPGALAGGGCLGRVYARRDRVGP